MCITGGAMPSRLPWQKNATMADYRKATGLEAVMGYLYLRMILRGLFHSLSLEWSF